MTQKERELLFKDLCARLPYKVKVYNTTFKEPTIQTLYGKISSDEFLMEETYTSVGVDGDDFGPFNKRYYTGHIDFIKPYLRPLSSMTKEEDKEYAKIVVKSQDCSYENNESATTMVNDWYLSKGFDVRGLIPKGLALEAPEGMYDTSQKWTTIRSGLKENEDGQIVGGLKL